MYTGRAATPRLVTSAHGSFDNDADAVHCVSRGGISTQRLGAGVKVAMSDKSGFRSAESRQRYLAVYDRVRSLSPAPDAVHDVGTEFGTVRAYQHGPNGGVPMVLLLCFWATSAMWAEHIPARTDDFTIYTVDILGQSGASEQTKPMKTPDHCAR